jgi:hypothetical protein
MLKLKEKIFNHSFFWSYQVKYIENQIQIVWSNKFLNEISTFNYKGLTKEKSFMELQERRFHNGLPMESFRMVIINE